MSRLIGYRLLAVIPMLMGVAILAFSLLHLSPTDPARLILGEGAGEDAISDLRSQMGLDEPIWEQFVSWMANAATGDFGESLFTGRPAVEMLMERMPVTLSLALLATLLATVAGIGSGLFASLRAGGIVDRTILGLASLGMSIPGFWLALLLSLLFAVRLRWFPVIGYEAFSIDPVEWARSMVLPTIALAVRPGAIIARQTRNAMVDVLNAPFVQSVRARGLPRRTVVGRYVVRNGVMPVVTTVGLEATVILAVSFVIERIFSLPGVGSLIVDGVVRSDFTVVQAGVVLVATIAIFIHLLVDITYGLIDPRSRPQ